MKQKHTECEKLGKIQQHIIEIMDFLEFLKGKDIFLGEWYSEWRMLPTQKAILPLLYEFYEIDSKKLEEERRKIISLL